jgi:hypothetical protein
VTEAHQCVAHSQGLVDVIERSEMIDIIDGSYQDNTRTVAWRLSYINVEDQQWTGQLQVPGQPSAQSVFRSELAGMYAMITLVHLVVEYDVRHGTVGLACDGIQELEYIFDTDKSVTSAKTYHDLILAMRNMIADSRITWKRRRAKGHQDIPRDQLDIWGRANAESYITVKAF